MSNFSHNTDWTKDSNNYVAKRYMEDVERQTYFEDVKLQMDAKLWGEECKKFVFYLTLFLASGPVLGH